MARNQEQGEEHLSILDRLMDDDPEVRQDAGRQQRHTLKDLRVAVSRDLENLLNTRKRAIVLDDHLKESRSSVIAYGVPDTAGTTVASRSARLQLLRRIEEIITRFEPRFKRVKVVSTEASDPLDRTLRFKIEAVLSAGPAPEHVSYESQLEPVRRSFVVKGRQ